MFRGEIGMFSFLRSLHVALFVCLFSTCQSVAVHADTQSSDDRIYFTASGGLSFADVSSYAASTAQLGASALGQTVTYSYDRATWGGRFGGGYEVSDNVSLELNYFFSGDIDITYSIASGVAVEEAFSASGFDYSVKYDFDDSGIFVKAGMHNSDLGNSAAVTLNGTTYASASVSSSGTGTLIGAGYERKADNGDVTFFGYDLYMDIGDVAGADFGYLYYGWRF